MKLYWAFNSYVYDTFFKGNNGDSIYLNFDDIQIVDFCQSQGITESEFWTDISLALEYSWHKLLYGKSDYPKYLGLIAVQIHAAYLMHADSLYSSGNYRVRLAHLLGIQEDEVSRLFNNYQDELWQGLKKWCDIEHFSIKIPDIGYGKGRYIRYPMSIPLINNHDLNKLPELFYKVGLRLNENISFNSFKGLVESQAERVLGSHYVNTKRRAVENNSLDELFKQMFSYYYNAWDGFYEPDTQVNSSTGQVKEKNENLFIDEGLRNIQLRSLSGELKNEWALRSTYGLFDAVVRTGVKTLNSEYWLFKKNDDYNDWEEVRFFEIGFEYLILTEFSGNIRHKIHSIFGHHLDFSSLGLTDLEIAITPILEEDHFHEGSIFFGDKSTLVYSGGLKLDRNAYMIGAGPKITFLFNGFGWVNGKHLEVRENDLLDPDTYRLGRNVIKIGGQIFHFEIQLPNWKLWPFEKGWQLSRQNDCWKPSTENLVIKGVSIMLEPQSSQMPFREWVKAINKESRTQAKQQNINAIIRANNGRV